MHHPSIQAHFFRLTQDVWDLPNDHIFFLLDTVFFSPNLTFTMSQSHNFSLPNLRVRPSDIPPV